MEYVGNYVELKHWARKDFYRPYGARNLYYVGRETEKAVKVVPVDHVYNQDPEPFWAPKSAVTNIVDSHGHVDN